jgi:SOS-response transcriptional repressor LexA
MTSGKQALRAQAARRQVWAFIQAFVDEHGYAPSLREIGAGVWLSPSNAQKWVWRLVADGVLDFQPGVSRSIRLLKRLPD